ncbi:MAG: hypothetical protein AAF518_09145, partial [Spirochaetota bacterium]
MEKTRKKMPGKRRRVGIVSFLLIFFLSICNKQRIESLEIIKNSHNQNQIKLCSSEETLVNLRKEPLEQSLRQMPEMKEILSTSKPGMSIITVEFQEQYFDMEDIWTDM